MCQQAGQTDCGHLRGAEYPGEHGALKGQDGHLLPKADGVVLTKKRYLIPLDGSDHLTIELDVFEGRYAGLILAEVEFTSEEEAMAFQAPEWFGRDVTFTREYQNSRLACGK